MALLWYLFNFLLGERPLLLVLLKYGIGSKKKDKVIFSLCVREGLTTLSQSKHLHS